MSVFTLSPKASESALDAMQRERDLALKRITKLKEELRRANRQIYKLMEENHGLSKEIMNLEEERVHEIIFRPKANKSIVMTLQKECDTLKEFLIRLEPSIPRGTTNYMDFIKLTGYTYD